MSFFEVQVFVYSEGVIPERPPQDWKCSAGAQAGVSVISKREAPDRMIVTSPAKIPVIREGDPCLPRSAPSPAKARTKEGVSRIKESDCNACTKSHTGYGRDTAEHGTAGPG